jgi:hypothetical protein
VIQLAVAAYAGWVLERTIKALREAGAISEETAKTPKELNLDEKWLKMSANTIIPSGVVTTKDGRYYFISKNEKQQ